MRLRVLNRRQRFCALKNTNKMLVETLDEVVKIQNDGRQKRREAEQELGRIEGELKQKLLDIRQ